MMLNSRTRFYVLFSLFVLFLSENFGKKLLAQNMEKVGKKDMIGISGGLNFNSILLHSNHPSSTRDPFS